jgi:hypothetical protein
MARRRFTCRRGGWSRGSGVVGEEHQVARGEITEADAGAGVPLGAAAQLLLAAALLGHRPPDLPGQALVEAALGDQAGLEAPLARGLVGQPGGERLDLPAQAIDPVEGGTVGPDHMLLVLGGDQRLAGLVVVPDQALDPGVHAVDGRLDAGRLGPQAGDLPGRGLARGGAGDLGVDAAEGDAEQDEDDEEMPKRAQGEVPFTWRVCGRAGTLSRPVAADR